jgi:polysaccharide chain length determinant protein (PEP-CTERM system associated)
MLPGKKYKPEDYVQVAWARRWFVIVPFVLATAGAVTYAMLQPNRYRAQTSIIITPQQVPRDYVESTITTLLADRLQMISQQILSRTRLERVIEEFNLYPEMRANRIMQDVVEQMKSKDINVTIAPNRRQSDSGAFTISYTSDDPRTALLVTERLASLFIRENTEDRAILAEATDQFLEAQLEESRRKLMDHEAKLEEYKRRNTGSLPTQVQSNLQAIQTAQMQLQALHDAGNRDRDRRLFLERAIADAQADANLQPSAAATDPAAVVNTAAPAAQRLEAARALLRGLAQRLKPEHPDMVRAKRMIRDLEKQAEAEALEHPVSDAPSARGLTPAERMRQSRISAMQAEIETIDRRLAGRQADEQKVRSTLAAYQARVEAAPARESEMAELMRDYETLRLSYNDLLRKSQASNLAVNLERRQIGEQFKIIDGARLPERPVSPNRPRIIGFGAFFGLAFGLALVALLEYRDATVKTDDDVVMALALPVLAQIPAMVTRAEERASVRRRRLIAVTSIAAFVMAAGAAAWKLQLFDGWLG